MTCELGFDHLDGEALDGDIGNFYERQNGTVQDTSGQSQLGKESDSRSNRAHSRGSVVAAHSSRGPVRPVRSFHDAPSTRDAADKSKLSPYPSPNGVQMSSLRDRQKDQTLAAPQSRLDRASKTSHYKLNDVMQSKIHNEPEEVRRLRSQMSRGDDWERTERSKSITRPLDTDTSTFSSDGGTCNYEYYPNRKVYQEDDVHSKRNTGGRRRPYQQHGPANDSFMDTDTGITASLYGSRGQWLSWL